MCIRDRKYFNAETGKEIPEEEIDSYEGACDVEADDYTQKTYTAVSYTHLDVYKRQRLERSMSIINTIISLTKTLGLSVITEGVETKEQIDELTRMGCGIYQGYYFSKPIPVGQFEDTYL